jgi:CRISPR/Cas system CSM-associated protein Csm4 (group 5 of RAMP superfamily)
MFVYSIQPDDAPSIERDYIYLGDGPDGIETSVCHSDIRGQKVASIKRNEFLRAPTIAFAIRIASEISHKLPDEALAAVILHMAEHGIGASRSQGNGKFDIVSIEDVPAVAA